MPTQAKVLLRATRALISLRVSFFVLSWMVSGCVAVVLRATGEMNRYRKSDGRILKTPTAMNERAKEMLQPKRLTLS